jgi:hypothetical protein
MQRVWSAAFASSTFYSVRGALRQSYVKRNPCDSELLVESISEGVTNCSNARYTDLEQGLPIMAEGKFISYLRVSTDKQGRSGLGIEAQREAVVRYLNGGQWTLSAEYVETESGRRSDRPKLTAALSHAKAIGAKLVFAKLDRLTRNVDLLRSLVASGVDLVFL